MRQFVQSNVILPGQILFCSDVSTGHFQKLFPVLHFFFFFPINKIKTLRCKRNKYKK